MTKDEQDDYESEMIEKISKDEMFNKISDNGDAFGDYVDRVIERSLYLYRNRYCFIY
jgi:hypothetical protein